MCRAIQTKLAWVGRIGDDRWDRVAVAHNINGTHHGRGTRRFRLRRTREPRRPRRRSAVAAAGGRVGAVAAAKPMVAVAPAILHPHRKLLFASGALSGGEFALVPPAPRNTAPPADCTVGEEHFPIFAGADFPSRLHYELSLTLVSYQGKGPIAAVNHACPIPYATPSHPDQYF